MLRLQQTHNALSSLLNIRERQARRGDRVQMDHLRRGINTQTLVLFERDRGRKFLAVALIFNGDIVLAGGRSDRIVHIHPTGAGHSIDT